MQGELNYNRIDALLRSENIGRMACHADGIAYVVPVIYTYEDGSIIGYVAPGIKIEMMNKNPNICFEVDRIYNMASWQCVIAWGTFRELSGEEALNAKRILVNKLPPILLSTTLSPGQDRGGRQEHGLGEGAVMFRIKLHTTTGRYEESA